MKVYGADLADLIRSKADQIDKAREGQRRRTRRFMRDDFPEPAKVRQMAGVLDVSNEDNVAEVEVTYDVCLIAHDGAPLGNVKFTSYLDGDGFLRALSLGDEPSLDSVHPL
jgi:hypothetical protein